MSDPSRAVFLSYASQDAEAAHRICEALRASGIEVWFDKSELRGGDAWDQMIRRQIRECSLFIPVMSATTAQRAEGYFRLEWALADQRSQMIARNKAFIVPVCLDDTFERGADVPESFQRVHWTKLPTAELPRAFIERIKSLLGEPPAAASAATSATIAVSTSAPAVGRRWRLAIGVAALALVLLGSGLWFAWRGAAPGREGLPDKSIAVLPFEDLSEHRDQAYFADGLAEQVLDLLAQVPDLRVPARSSSFYFRGRRERLSSIAAELRVANVLEGTVRRAGDKVRISVQLVRADTGFHMWSAIYDRDVKDIFRVQDEISTAVVEALKAKLAGPPAGSSERRTANAGAYDQYLLARYLYNQNGEASWRRSEAAYREAIKLDPAYAPAYAGLAMVVYLLPSVYGSEFDAASVAQAEQMAEKAIQLAPDLAEPYSVRAYLRMYAGFDLKGAQADIARAVALDPNDSAVQRRRGFIEIALGRLDAGLAASQRAVELSPLDPNSLDALATALQFAGRAAEARALWARTLAVAPNFQEGLHSKVGWAWLQDGAVDEARRECGLGHGTGERVCLAVADVKAGDERARRAALEHLAAMQHVDDPYSVASGFAALGDPKQALSWLSRAYDERQQNLIGWVAVDPIFRSLHGDPAFQALVRKLGISD